MGNAIAILIGQVIGSGSVKDIKKYAYQLEAFSVEISIVSAILMAVTAIVFPSVYNTTDEVKMLAQYLLWAYAFFMPSMAYTNAVYFIIRSGGKTFVTFLFDSCYSWGVEVPIAFLLSRYTAMPLIWLYVCVQTIEFFKGVADKTCMILLEAPYVDEILAIKDKDLAKFRREELGFVFQDFNLLDTFSIKDNILLPLVLAGAKKEEMESKVVPLASKLGIEKLLNKYPYEVSGGEKQRAACCRAVITNPKMLLADEPTGALDSKSTDDLLKMFDRINKDGQTILMVTHSVKAASFASRVLFIKDGEVYHQLYKGDLDNLSFYSKITDSLQVMIGVEK